MLRTAHKFLSRTKTAANNKLDPEQTNLLCKLILASCDYIWEFCRTSTRICVEGDERWALKVEVLQIKLFAIRAIVCWGSHSSADCKETLIRVSSTLMTFLGVLGGPLSSNFQAKKHLSVLQSVATDIWNIYVSVTEQTRHIPPEVNDSWVDIFLQLYDILANTPSLKSLSIFTLWSYGYASSLIVKHGTNALAQATPKVRLKDVSKDEGSVLKVAETVLRVAIACHSNEASSMLLLLRLWNQLVSKGIIGSLEITDPAFTLFLQLESPNGSLIKLLNVKNESSPIIDSAMTVLGNKIHPAEFHADLCYKMAAILVSMGDSQNAYKVYGILAGLILKFNAKSASELKVFDSFLCSGRMICFYLSLMEC